MYNRHINACREKISVKVNNFNSVRLRPENELFKWILYELVDNWRSCCFLHSTKLCCIVTNKDGILCNSMLLGMCVINVINL